VFFHVFAQTTHVVAAPHRFACVGIPRNPVIYSTFHRNPFRGFGTPWVKIWPFPLLWLVAFTTACTTVQAVTSRLSSAVYHTKRPPPLCCNTVGVTQRVAHFCLRRIRLVSAGLGANLTASVAEDGMIAYHIEHAGTTRPDGRHDTGRPRQMDRRAILDDLQQLQHVAGSQQVDHSQKPKPYTHVN